MAAVLGPQSARAFVDYYASLLILQYLNLTKASGTVKTQAAPALIPQTTLNLITFATAPTSGTFILNYLTGLATSAINWNDTASQIQTKLRAVTGLGAVTVTGSIAALSLLVTLTGVAPPSKDLTISANSLTGASGAITPVVNVTDVTLPFAVMNGFNINAALGPTAVGAQLDIIGKYAGVTRNSYAFSGAPITLNDADFLSLIQLAVIRNSAGSSLATIQALLATFFPGEILVFDYANMQMSYLVNSSLGSQNFIQAAINENLLPKPMGVQVASIIYAPNITKLFGFRTYTLNTANNSPFNSYTNYTTNTPWLSYTNAV